MTNPAAQLLWDAGEYFAAGFFELLDASAARKFCRGTGGVTVTGGEPLMQPEFTAALLRACREMGVHTCVETCGYGSAEALEEVRKHTDLFLFDYKVTGDELHRKYTGVSNQTILRNPDALCGRGAEVILRCPMIPGVNMEAAHADAIAQLACRYESIREIHLEPYHPLGLSKNAALGRKVAYNRAESLDKGDVEPIAESIRARVRVGVRVV